MTMLELKGVVPALTTPFDEDIKPLSLEQRDTIRAALEEIHLLPASRERTASA
jgi:dihydrodipicolinate synthase/N-acetylneuraminate lyase